MALSRTERIHTGRRIAATVLILGCAWIAAACGQSQVSELATRYVRTMGPPSPAATPRPIVATPYDAIRIARTVVSPYIATWQDVVATEESGIWRVAFRNYDALPPGTVPNDDYWRVPLSVFIDAATGIVLRQGYV
jgi:hypothetical protein